MGAAIWVIHTGPKSGCKLPTIFGSDCDDGVSAAVWVIHTSPKSGCNLLFESDCDNVVSAVIGVEDTSPKSGCKLLTFFLTFFGRDSNILIML